MKNIKVRTNINIKTAMKTLDKTAEKCLLVVNDNDELLGTLTDGDIRRAILSGMDFSTTINNIYQKKYIVIKSKEFTKEKAIKLLKNKKIELIPIVDDENKLVNFVSWSKLDLDVKKIKSILSNVPVVIMAGGEGKRLAPFTDILPKALIPVKDKTIIEHIINSFTEKGCKNFFMTVNYKQKILKAFFEDLNPDYSISHIIENKPLGTAGSIKLIKNKFKVPFFVSNCDIIIKTDYSKIYEFHKKNNYDITLIASAKEYEIPYGTCELNSEGSLHCINEKPKYDFLINTGLYILNPDIKDIIPRDKFYHITDLIEDSKKQGKKIGVYPINEDAWIDVGQWAQYKNALKII